MFDVRLLATDACSRDAYFSDPARAQDRLWLPSDNPHGADFGYLTTNSAETIVDVFDGCMPRYHDATRIRGHGVALKVVQTLVLDSNVSGQILSYVENAMRDPTARAGVERFLRWFASSPSMNVTPAYNLLERFPRSVDQNKAEEMALRTARAVLTVETMDRDYYLATGVLRPASDASDILRSQTGSGDFETVAQNAVADTKHLAKDQVEAFFAFMLKVGLIAAQRPKPRELVAKVDELIDFVEKRLGVVASIEISAALLQFTGGLRKFATISRGMSFDAAVKRIEHAAWDLAYVRTPLMFLRTSTPAHTTLGFVITGDRDAAAIMRLARFRMLLVTPSGPYQYLDAYFDAVAEAYGDDAVFDEAMERLNAFVGRRSISKIHPDIGKLIQELLEELRKFLDP